MSLLEAAVGWLAPALCVGCGAEGASLCLACSSSEIIPHGERCFACGAVSERGRTCEHCRRLGGPRYVWISTDYEGLAKEVIHKYKFGQQRAAAESLAKVMADTFLDNNSDDDIERLNYLIVPVPTATSRIRQRGFDHSVLLAKKLSPVLAAPIQESLLRLDQSRQLGAPRQTRLRQLEGRFMVKKYQAIAGRNLLLVDDVLTTGGTLCAAAKTLRKAGARRVDALVFAKRL